MDSGVIETLQINMVKTNNSILQILSYYKDYVLDGNENSLNQLIALLQKYVLNDVSRILLGKYCYSKENLEDVMQIGSLNAWKVAKKDCSEHLVRDNMLSYYKGIYIKSALGFIRDNVKNKINYQPVSIDEKLNEEIPIDILPPVEGVEEQYEKTESNTVYWEIFVMYCQALSIDYKIPPRNLALFYSRILYHIECNTDNSLSSPKWAIERMGKMTVRKLRDESNLVFKKFIDDSIRWSKEFNDSIEIPYPEANPILPFGNVIYTDAFKKERIENLSENMHSVLIKAVHKKLKNDIKISNKMASYVEHSVKLAKLFI